MKNAALPSGKRSSNDAALREDLTPSADRAGGSGGRTITVIIVVLKPSSHHNKDSSSSYLSSYSLIFLPSLSCQKNSKGITR